VPFGPRKVEIFRAHPFQCPSNDVAPLKTITYRAIKTTGTLIVIRSPPPLLPRYLSTCPVQLLRDNHRVHIYLEYHNVCPLVQIGNPHPLSRIASECVPPPEPRGGGHTLACGDGVGWEVPIRTTILWRNPRLRLCHGVNLGERTLACLLAADSLAPLLVVPSRDWAKGWPSWSPAGLLWIPERNSGRSSVGWLNGASSVRRSKAYCVLTG
jgi:hypothetical protein